MGDGWGVPTPGTGDTRRQRISFRVFVALVLVGGVVLVWASSTRGENFGSNVVLGVIGFFVAVGLVEKLVMWINEPDRDE